MRPTWHFVLPSDIGWLQELTAPRVKALLASYDRREEVDRALLVHCYAVLELALRDRQSLTRSELVAELEKAGIPTSSQRMVQILMHAELDCLIVSGPRRGKQQTYALLAERAPTLRRLDRDEALAELTRRYFASHGPALVDDFVWWSGLTRADATRGLDLAGRTLDRQVVGKKAYWWHPDAPAPGATSTAHLLPNFDEFLVAYSDRSASLQHMPDLSASEVLSNVVVLDGQVHGFWRLRRQAREAVLELTLSDPRDAEMLRSATETLARYLGTGIREKLDPLLLGFGGRGA